jgi:hypothetical protein
VKVVAHRLSSGASRTPQPTDMVTCLLCRHEVMYARMVQHLEEVHLLNKYGEPLGVDSHRHQWVHFYQGGLPGLGKRK